jgi:hypothetical protein
MVTSGASYPTDFFTTIYVIADGRGLRNEQCTKRQIPTAKQSSRNFYFAIGTRFRLIVNKLTIHFSIFSMNVSEGGRGGRTPLVLASSQALILASMILN